MLYANYIREKTKNILKYAEAEGNPITVADSLERPIRDMNLLGESVQEGTPTPKTPADIVSTENPVVEICGKNLIPNEIEEYPTQIGPSSIVKFDKSYAFRRYAPSGYSHTSGGGVIWNGEPYTDTATEAWYGLGISVPVKPNTNYCVSFDIEKTESVYYAVAFYVDGVHIKQQTITPGVAFTTPDAVNGIIISFRVGDNKAPYTISNLQLEMGTSMTVYEPYVKPQRAILDGITMRGLKSTDGSWKARDEIVVDGKKKTVKLVKRCWEVSLDGNAAWAVYDNASGYEGFMTSNNVLPESYARREPAICNQCRVDYNTMWIGVGNKLVYWVGPQARQFYDAALADKGLANLKAHLNENPLKIVSYYKEPIETDITDTEAGQKLLELYTNKRTTNIFLNSESDLGEIWVRYVRK